LGEDGKPWRQEKPVVVLGGAKKKKNPNCTFLKGQKDEWQKTMRDNRTNDLLAVKEEGGKGGSGKKLFGEESRTLGYVLDATGKAGCLTVRRCEEISGGTGRARRVKKTYLRKKKTSTLKRYSGVIIKRKA